MKNRTERVKSNTQYRENLNQNFCTLNSKKRHNDTWRMSELTHSVKEKRKAVSNYICTHSPFNYHVCSGKVSDVAAAV